MKSISYFIIIIKILLNLSKSLYFIKSTENSLNSNELSIPARPEFAFDAYPQIQRDSLDEPYDEFNPGFDIAQFEVGLGKKFPGTSKLIEKTQNQMESDGKKIKEEKNQTLRFNRRLMK